MAVIAEKRDAEWLAGEVSRMTGEPFEQVLDRARRERWMEPVEPVMRDISPEELEASMAEIRRIQDEIAALPVLDDRTADEIIGYDENGLFG